MAQTTRQILEEQTKSLVQLTMDVSIATNRINDVHKILYHNHETNQRGLVEIVYDNDNRLDNIETDKKVLLGKVAVASVIFAAIGTFAWKIIDHAWISK